MAMRLISISVRAKAAEVVSITADLAAVGVFSDGARLSGPAAALDKKLGGAISKIIRTGDFTGKAKSSVVVYGNGKVGPKRVLVVGLGEKGKLKSDTIRRAALTAASKAVSLKAKTVVIALHQVAGKKFDNKQMGQAIAEGVHLGGYRYDEFMSKAKEERIKSLAAVVVDADSAVVRELSAGVKVGNVIGKAQSFARTLVYRPANVVAPAVLAAAARKLARDTAEVSCTVFDEKQIKQKNMGGVMAVGQGSANKSRFIVVKYTPSRCSKKGAVGLVGKAVTFDSGGLCIKPSAGMQDMKMDMAGGAMMLGAVKAAAELKLGVPVYAIVPSAENMPGGGSYRSGDIVTTYSGKTVEIQNTDAEGRMLLCDAIEYARRLKCEVIIDAATLTGACVVALGKYSAGVFSNDDKLADKLKKASVQSGEKVWHLPCGDEYTEEMKSEIADLKNIGSRWGGACTAASFLREFAGEDVLWAHLDIAGPGMYDPAVKSTSGSTGFGVRLLIAYLMSLAGGKKRRAK